MFNEWKDFKNGNWQKEIDVRNFIIKNYHPYDGDDNFLVSPTNKTKKIWDISNDLIVDEIHNKTIKVELNKFSGIDNFGPGYIDKENEIIVGLQTDEPLKRIVNPYGGMRSVKQSLEAYNYKISSEMERHFNEYRKTHNDGVFDAYTKEMRLARSAGLLTGLPDAYGRGRIIGDYRRIPLYGMDFLMKQKQDDYNDLEIMSEFALAELIQLREEISEQYKAMKKIKKMAESYGIDISKPAKNAAEAVQFLYFGYLAGVKENNGAAMSLGRVSTFLDIYIERDLQNGIITEIEAQEIIDQFVIKLRMIRHLRTPEYDELFAGDPNWITECIGGVGINGKHLVTKNSFRFLHTLTNLDPAPEPNMTVLWSEKLPENFKKYCSKMSIDTDSIQYENDDLMRPIYGDDYGIACCISGMELGKRMQFFGARANLAKSLLYAINGGIDENTGEVIVPNIEKDNSAILDYEKVKNNYWRVLEYVAKLYVDTMNTIHYMHDKYAYEASQMALHDSIVKRFMAFGIAGLSCIADSLSAIKHAKVMPIVNQKGIIVDFNIEGDFPKYGNDDDNVDDIAIEVVKKFSNELKKHSLYRNAEHTLSVLTITSNVVYGKKTGKTPDGRPSGEPLAPGANPMHGRDTNGILASLNTVAKIPYKEYCQDGVSNTFTVIPEVLGKEEETRIINLSNILDGYFSQGGFHLNVNVLNREKLEDAMENPEKYPLLTIRVSGYAVHFNRLTREQQIEVLNRTFHNKF